MSQTAYEKYEMPHINGKPKTLTEDDVVSSLLTPEVKAKFAEMRNTAKAVGRKEGYTEGHYEGLEAGKVEASEIIRQDHELLKGIHQTLQATLPERADDIAIAVTEMALDLARFMFRGKLEANPEAMIPIVKEAISSLPFIESPAKILLNPDDVELVREYMGDSVEQFMLEEDANISRGGCKIITRTNHVDATNETRWRHLLQSMGYMENEIPLLDQPGQAL